MDIKPIRNEQDLATAFVRMDALWGASAGSPCSADEQSVIRWM
jgi:hypothetical protein